MKYILILGLLLLIIVIIIIISSKKKIIKLDNKRIVITLTTTPTRLPLIEKTLLSLVAQTRKPDLIYLNIPKFYNMNITK